MLSTSSHLTSEEAHGPIMNLDFVSLLLRESLPIWECPVLPAASKSLSLFVSEVYAPCMEVDIFHAPA